MKLTDRMLIQIIKEARLYEVQKRIIAWKLKKQINGESPSKCLTALR